jgi:hypothetical protein
MKVVWPMVPSFEGRNDLYPCDIEGNFLSTGTATPIEAVVVEPVVDEKVETAEATDENRTKVALMGRAKELGVPYAHLMNEETLLQKIAEKEAEAESTEED